MVTPVPLMTAHAKRALQVTSNRMMGVPARFGLTLRSVPALAKSSETPGAVLVVAWPMLGHRRTRPLRKAPMRPSIKSRKAARLQRRD
jgi:hypothetical protein